MKMNALQFNNGKNLTEQMQIIAMLYIFFPKIITKK